MTCSIRDTKLIQCIGCNESFQTRIPNVTIEKIDDVTVQIKINQFFTFSASNEFIRLGKQCFLNNSIKKVKVDLNGIETISQIDSSAFGMLTLMKNKMPNAVFEFENLSAQIEKIFEVTNIICRLNK